MMTSDHGDTGAVRGEPVSVRPAPLARAAPSPPKSREPDTAASKDPFADPFFAKDPKDAKDPLDDMNLPSSPEYDDVRATIERARKRYRDMKADADRQMSSRF